MNGMLPGQAPMQGGGSVVGGGGGNPVGRPMPSSLPQPARGQVGRPKRPRQAVTPRTNLAKPRVLQRGR